MTNSSISLVDPKLAHETPERYVDAIVRQAGTSFYWAMRRLDPERRRALFAVYAFCRVVDDVADAHIDVAEKTETLEVWRAQIRNLYNGDIEHPIMSEVNLIRVKFGLREEDFLHIVDGMMMDAQARVRLQSLSELEIYCDRVACAVGRHCVRIFGLEEDPGIRLAHELGMALQLTNILRDIAEDAARDRIYLPFDWLKQAGAESETVQEALTAPQFGSVCQRLVQLAERHYGEAEAIMASVSGDTVRPARMMMGAYKLVLNRIKKRGWDELNVRVRLSRLEKLIIAIRYGVLT